MFPDHVDAYRALTGNRGVASNADGTRVSCNGAHNCQTCPPEGRRVVVRARPPGALSGWDFGGTGTLPGLIGRHPTTSKAIIGKYDSEYARMALAEPGFLGMFARMSPRGVLGANPIGGSVLYG